MTKAEAIESLSLLKIFDAPDLNEAVKVAISAIRAQQTPLDRSRWEGCDECGEYIYKCEKCKYHSISCEETTLTPVIYSYCIKLNADCYDLRKGFSPKKCPCFELPTNVRFCKKCGRPLTEEAWAELERRINGGTTDNEAQGRPVGYQE